MKFKSHIVLLFTFVMLFHSIKSGLMVSFYLADSKSFIEFFCVNKDKPELKCNGKCELSKMAQINDATSEKPTYFNFLHREITLFLYQNNLKIPFENQKANKVNSFYLNRYSFLSETNIYHPPAA